MLTGGVNLFQTRNNGEFKQAEKAPPEEVRGTGGTVVLFIMNPAASSGSASSHTKSKGNSTMAFEAFYQKFNHTTNINTRLKIKSRRAHND